MSTLRAPLCWRDCEYVSAANAARIAGRTPGWVRGAIVAGELRAVRLPTGGPPVVTVESLVRLLDSAAPLDGPAVPAGRRSPLRLVADNS
ncbi:hypothetical protein [Tranquillimonas alkanivorans]|uniref:Helix-turn-helix domain-containing protein n=1 Tax=Tranquillimonas alkanivorans TaxID=441119 RepID=A0A1I5PBU7_9RHOB|nr:hypothetical protein [Tranquillimonas alkanivorans]SFP31525.1 hypothetical protein SAMN04488047_10523 [Tranquillimonas alkanivorans]